MSPPSAELGTVRSLSTLFLVETSKKVVAARGDLTKVDWFDVVTSTAARRLGLGAAGSMGKEVLNALVDAKISDGEIKLAFKNKDNSAVFLDLTFSSFKQLVGQIANETGASKLSEDQMKMLFDQVKTQINEEIKKAGKVDK